MLKKFHQFSFQLKVNFFATHLIGKHIDEIRDLLFLLGNQRRLLDNLDSNGSLFLSSSNRDIPNDCTFRLAYYTYSSSRQNSYPIVSLEFFVIIGLI